MSHAVLVKITAVLFVASLSYGLVFDIALRPQAIVADESDGALWFGASTFANGLVGVVAAPLLGALSDTQGRKPLLISALLLVALELLACGLVDNILVFVVARGVCGGVGASYWGIASAAIFDTSTKENKSRHIGVSSGVAIGLGFVIGPVVGGMLASVGSSLPYAVGACCVVGSALFVYVSLPETAPAVAEGNEHGRAENGAQGDAEADPLMGKAGKGFDAHSLNPLVVLGVLTRSPQVRLLAAILLVGALSFQGFSTTVVLYLDFKFSWETQIIGIYMAILGLSVFFAQTFLLPLLVLRLGDLGTSVFSAVWGTVVAAVYGFLSGDAAFWCALLFGPIALQVSTVVSMLSNLTDHADQGKLAGGAQVMDRIGKMFGSLGMTSAFAALTKDKADPHPEVLPLVLAGLGAIATALLLWYWRGFGADSPSRVAEKAS